MDLLERIKQVNKKSEENNRKSAQAQAQQRLLTEQISEKVAEYEQEFGISFPNIEDKDKFSKFLDRLVRTTEDELLKQVEVAEKVNQLILDGDIEGAQELLGYDFEANQVDDSDEEDIEEDVAEEDDTEEEPAEEVEEVEIDKEEVPEDEDEDIEDEPQEEEISKPVRRRPRRTVVSNDLDLDDLEDEEPVAKPTKRRKVVEDDDLEDEAPVAKPKRTRTRRAVVTSNFDMDGEDSSVSLEELNKVAQISPKGNPLEDVEEEEVPTVRRRRRKMVAVPDEEEVDDYVAPTRPVRSGGSFKFD
jgi:glutamic acid-rich protein